MTQPTQPNSLSQNSEMPTSSQISATKDDCAQVLSAWRYGLRPDKPTHDISREEAIARLVELGQSTAPAFGIEPETYPDWVDQQLDGYDDFFESFCGLCQNSLKISPYPVSTLWSFWMPLAWRLEQLRNQSDRPIIQGILGGQGTGKTTLALVLTALLEHRGYRVCGVSIDDLYKTYAERQALMQVEPRLRWRGPPGTHDVELGLQVLRQFKQGDNQALIEVPRFDKSLHGGEGDRIAPEQVEAADIILFEGWFVGARPIDPAAFDTAPPPIQAESDRQFARSMNERLRDYLPLWNELDSLMVLYPSDYRLSQQWRQQAEHKMKATGKSGMSDEDIQAFVEYFWRSLHPELFITPLLSQPEWVDLVVEVNSDRSIRTIYQPEA
ncbi:MAG: hypothetical protein WBA57_05490 [Elainellaceae cyanobacterium]